MNQFYLSNSDKHSRKHRIETFIMGKHVQTYLDMLEFM